MTNNAPKGYRPLPKPSRFNTLCGPYFEKATNDASGTMALRIEDKHLNQRDIMHGGMLMSLADNAMSDVVLQANKDKAGVVTVSMTSDFLKPARTGDLVEARAVVDRTGRTLAFASCELYVGDALIFRASGVFAILA